MSEKKKKKPKEAGAKETTREMAEEPASLSPPSTSKSVGF